MHLVLVVGHSQVFSLQVFHKTSDMSIRASSCATKWTLHNYVNGESTSLCIQFAENFYKIVQIRIFLPVLFKIRLKNTCSDNN